MRLFDFAPPIELHKDLNPKLWAKDGHLLPEVNDALLKIAKVFYRFLETDATLIDITVTGSQSNYNYTDLSDLDLHLVIPYMDVSCANLSVDEYFDTKRQLWKARHNITIRGIPVELYAEDLDKPATSAVYSLVAKKWIKPPPAPTFDYDVDAVIAETEKWSGIIDSAVKSKSLDMMNHVKDMLARYRKEGLAKEGEFGIANLTFKALRNSNKIKLLMGTIHHLGDDDLSLK
jgi:hypothetical protein